MSERIVCAPRDNCQSRVHGSQQFRDGGSHASVVCHLSAGLTAVVALCLPRSIFLSASASANTAVSPYTHCRASEAELHGWLATCERGRGGLHENVDAHEGER